MHDRIKKYLKRYRVALGKVRRTEEKRMEYMCRATRISPCGGGGGKGGHSDKVGDNAAEMVKLDAEIEELNAEAERIKAEIIEAAGYAGSESGKAVITMHFIDGLTFSEIGKAIGYSEQNIYKIYHKSLTKIEKVEF
ncbi:MAG: sigma factor-like helix-turn-helix DNA-binding protein [Ruminiclostridium sp.]